MSVCRHCHSRVGDKQRQCFVCGWDWHDEAHSVQRGTIDWKRLGLDVDAEFVVDLCETENGARYLEYRMVGTRVSNEDFVIHSEVTLSAEIRSWAFQDIEQRLRLFNGRLFRFDDQGYWQADLLLSRVGKIDRKWRKSTIGLISIENAKLLAAKYGESQGFAAFQVIHAELHDDEGRPVWLVLLDFEDGSLDFIAPVVRVEADTGKAFHLAGL